MKQDATRREFLQISSAFWGALALGCPLLAESIPPRRTIHPHPNEAAWGACVLNLGRRVRLAVGRDTEPGVVAMMQTTWRQFTLNAVEMTVAMDSKLCAGEFSLGGPRPPERQPRDTYALRADPSGMAASAVDTAAMRHAWFTLLQLLEAGDDHSFSVPQVEIHDWPAVKFRGVHLCVFHETTPLMIEKAIQLAAFFKFTHVVVEFWGMLHLDALKELAWPEAWSKAAAQRLINIAQGLGLEVIPTFNCWGHAAASRIKHGRHVVLDQNPTLAPLFEPDGWTWCLTNPRSQDLLRRVCDELSEVAGAGQYFHIGCDEAYSHATCDRCRQVDRVKLFADHVNALAAHLEKRGRRAIMWGDALLERAKWPRPFEANGTPALPTHEALQQISWRVMIADWQYDVTTGDVPTLAYFREHGFETLTCPWNSAANIRTLAKAAVANHSGLLMTTWHHLSDSIPTLAWTANCAWSENQAALGMEQNTWPRMHAATATDLRKLVPAEGQFGRAGWNSVEQPLETD